MPRSMSFALTTEQIRNRTKTVTRRLGWANLNPGQLFWAVEKAQGLKKGEKVQRLVLLRCKSNTATVLDSSSLTQNELAREGFPLLNRSQFVAMFVKANGCKPKSQVRRIEFEYVDEVRGAK